MGFGPAFDTYFKKGFGASTFGPKARRKIAAFDREHAAAIDAGPDLTLGFAADSPASRRYTRAKVIDMTFFIEGGGF